MKVFIDTILPKKVFKSNIRKITNWCLFDSQKIAKLNIDSLFSVLLISKDIMNALLEKSGQNFLFPKHELVMYLK